MFPSDEIIEGILPNGKTGQFFAYKPDNDDVWRTDEPPIGQLAIVEIPCTKPEPITYYHLLQCRFIRWDGQIGKKWIDGGGLSVDMLFGYRWIPFVTDREKELQAKVKELEAKVKELESIVRFPF